MMNRHRVSALRAMEVCRGVVAAFESEELWSLHKSVGTPRKTLVKAQIAAEVARRHSARLDGGP